MREAAIGVNFVCAILLAMLGGYFIFEGIVRDAGLFKDGFKFLAFSFAAFLNAAFIIPSIEPRE